MIVSLFVNPGMGDLESITEITGELTEVYMSRGNSWCTVGSHSFLTNNIKVIQFGTPKETTLHYPTHAQLVSLIRDSPTKQQ